MGEGQEVIAERAIKESFVNGNWVILYNCHLGLEFMSRMENILGKDVEIEDEFRLWLTCEPRDSFPIGLLQMAIKVTMEAPKGVKAGLERTFSTVIDNDYLEKHDSDKWRKYSFVVCFMHSVVIERRKFGPLGWCIPYEFNVSDLEASLHFIDQHMTQAETLNTPISVDTIRFMVTEIQYGGRITDSMDFMLIKSFGFEWIEDKITMGNFCFGDQP
mmetsp:Transcript_14200/g.2292  ORF Transcript_14200/g.2292 Transcript_14200/m.2292 type:complete len:216 (-) Transcript_14200:1131-1778(-)|eukprot:CAMPEP_0168314904 /NCGR_PEP_ID=MMETSP0210-20121227/9690_1 /TAXON_ID=40633 /ORGANISM="Condylostoma magnum, Strain COL2" /LENGTH=215 /DNA_ID=CAMNT_0008285493 /DNA_START=12021 /DNA_END=12668 /DNA_ORIENTATION=+